MPTSDPVNMFDFSHGQAGLVRFPPNVEKIMVERETTTTWLVASRNDVVLRFPLSDGDCEHLVH
jgi:hypothetical protein